MSTITVNTVQGIGDIFWVYQKLAPYFDVINLNILTTQLGTIQKRAEVFCHMLPKVERVTYQQVRSHDYMRLAQSRYSIDAVRNAKRHPVDYAVNAPLEVGVNLRDIDPGSEVESFVDLGQPATVERCDYLCVFVAGAKTGQVWAPPRWLPAIERLAHRLDTKRIHLIGAEWDAMVQREIWTALRRRYEVTNHVGADLATTIDIIRRSRMFLGYQSGLNVIAENYDVPQAMIYFAKLRPMLYTWCKPQSVRTIFHATTFADDVDAVIDGLPIEEIA